MSYTETSLDRESFSAAEVLLSLSGCALSVIRQLAKATLWDGDVNSKRGRDELVDKGLAWHVHGYQGLTADGCVVVLEDGALGS